jgi:LacI family transcriptional regulator
VQHWFAKHKVPCLVRGQVHAGINLPSLDQDWRAVAYHSAISLISKGHRSIGLVIPDISLRGLHAVKGGVEDAIAKSPYKIKLHLMEERGTTESLSALMHRACAASDSPTGILATRSRHVLTIVSWLASKRMSIPQDMSLISLTYDNVLSALLPKIAHYHLDVSNMARSFVRKVDAVIDGQGQGGKLLIPDFFAGESVRKLNPGR